MMQFLFMFLSLFQVKVNTEVIWENTTFDIALYENVDAYFLMPTAKVLVNGTYVYASYYQRGVQNTSITRVNSNHPKRHLVYYRAFFDTLDMDFTHEIIFNVQDIHAPTIENLFKFKVPLGQKIEDLTKNLIIVDDYSESKNLIVTVDTSHILKDHVGVYKVIYYVKDEALNERIYETTYEVVDLIAPEISTIKDLVHPVGKSFKYQDYFKAKDNYDAYVYIEIDYMDFNSLKVGVYEMMVSAFDGSGNCSVMVVMFAVVDLEKPDIQLTTNPSPIHVFEILTLEKLKSYVVSVRDNHDMLTLDDLSVSHDIDTYRIGTYHIYYEISDASNNVTKTSLKISVVDIEKPSVDQITPLFIEVHTPYFNYENYFEIEDNYNSIDELTIKVTHQIKLDKIGIYEFKITVTDQSKNVHTLHTYFEVIDSVQPNISLIESIIVAVNDVVDYVSYFDVSDNYDQKPVVVIENSQVILSKPGKYPLYVSVFDQSENMSQLEVFVEVIDQKKPEITMKTTHIYTDKILTQEDIINYIDEVKDDVTLYEKLSIDISFTMDDFLAMHTFSGVITVRDEAQNVVTQAFYIHYRENKPSPVFKSFDYEIFVNQQYEPLDYIETDIDFDRLLIADDHLDTTKKGKYEIKYYYTDSYGKLFVYKQVIEVVENQTFDFANYRVFMVALSLILFFGSYQVVLYYKTLKNRTFFDNP